MSSNFRTLLIAASAITFAATAASAAPQSRPAPLAPPGSMDQRAPAEDPGADGFILGIPISAIIAAASRPADHLIDERNPYRKPRPSPIRDYFPTSPPPPPVIADDRDFGRYNTNRERLAPWSREWYRHCANAYRSFNPRTGNYVDNHGRKRFCVPR